MNDAPERIWYSPEWNLCHRTKQSYNSKADITFGIEYILKSSADKKEQHMIETYEAVIKKLRDKIKELEGSI